jgi:hypothetical protein
MANPFRRVAQMSARPRPRATAQRNAFAGSSFSRLNSDWVMAAIASADGELRYELRTMRNRARELVRNSPFGAGITSSWPRTSSARPAFSSARRTC